MNKFHIHKISNFIVIAILITSCKADISTSELKEVTIDIEWQLIELPEKDPMAARISPEGNLYAIAAYQASLVPDIDLSLIYVSDDLGKSWSTISINKNNYVSPINIYGLIPVGHNRLIALARIWTTEMMFYSGDSGLTWKRTDSLLQTDNRDYVNKNVMTDLKGNVLVSGGYHIGPDLFKSTDFGQTWTSLDSPFRHPHYKTAFSSDSSTFFVYETGLYKTTDGGNTWSKISNDGWFSVVTNSKGIVVAVNRMGIIRSEDNGETWDIVEFNYGNNLVEVIALSDDSFLVMNNVGNLYYSKDGYSPWIRIKSTMEDGSKMENILRGVTQYGFQTKSIYEGPDKRLYIANKTKSEPNTNFVLITKKPFSASEISE